MDYGHQLRFGAFLTPSSAHPQDVVELAATCEAAGLDLVTFQDHPYQPAFLDTWTLLSYIAARTSTVTLAPNVANLPLRPPSMLARSAASLDLLSGGRVELGLGAGAFWDAIEALGGQRRSPAEAVRALEEAIRVIRTAWGREQDRFVGEFYRSKGAKTGPVPAHDIGIWVGAYKPRMLELTGSLADGWLPSLGRMSAGQIADANARIDDAAVAANRDPGAIVRLANVGGRMTPGAPSEWVERLTDLALGEGFSCFVLATDDSADLSVLGQEIAPAVREAVAGARR
jgi:alkanesulfonate monooxygenase SsuD/methylene tetrahydromethanopterin reductase-like flavin-dependent oxidoreductase (luciferase family)